VSIVTDQEAWEREPPPWPKSREPGVYFNLSDAEYHADPALSASYIRHLLVSPLTLWVHSSWLNPDYEDSDSDAKRFGRAADKLIVEGREAFHAAYAVELDQRDYPHALSRAEDLKEACRSLGLKVGGGKADLTARLIDDGYDGQIWDVLTAEHAAANAGKEPISAKAWKHIDLRARMVESHPDASRAFSGGIPQVSIFWRDEFTGCPMKCRMDYLKTQAIVDLKTFANMNDREPAEAFMRNMVQHRYDVQASVYLDGLANAKRMPSTAIHGADARTADLWQAIRSTEAHSFFFVAIQSGDVPNIVVREFARNVQNETQEYFTGAWSTYRHAVDLFGLCLSTFGTRPWVNTDVRRPFTDRDFPLYHMERLAS